MSRQFLATVAVIAIFATGASAQEATEATRATNDNLRNYLPFEDNASFENARRGLIATLDEDAIRKPDGTLVYDLTQFDFLQGDAPDTANPSLWRQSQLNAFHGLFEVVPGIYQIRF